MTPIRPRPAKELKELQARLDDLNAAIRSVEELQRLSLKRQNMAVVRHVVSRTV